MFGTHYTLFVTKGLSRSSLVTNPACVNTATLSDDDKSLKRIKMCSLSYQVISQSRAASPQQIGLPEEQRCPNKTTSTSCVFPSPRGLWWRWWFGIRITAVACKLGKNVSRVRITRAVCVSARRHKAWFIPPAGRAAGGSKSCRICALKAGAPWLHKPCLQKNTNTDMLGRFQIAGPRIHGICSRALTCTTTPMHTHANTHTRTCTNTHTLTQLSRH